MTWNIWHGGLHGTKADGFKKTPPIGYTINVYNVLLEENGRYSFDTYCCGMEITLKMPDIPNSIRASSNLSMQYPIIDSFEIFLNLLIPTAQSLM